jgi:hypothetical protein
LYSERLAAKVMSGGGAKASPRCLEKNPQELKVQEGIERLSGLNRLVVATDRCSDQCLEVEALGSGAGGATRRQESLANGMKARLIDEVSWLGSGETP